jgi:hypothetical protein
VTAPADSTLADAPPDRPRAAGASAFVVVAGLLVGAGAVAASSVLGSDLLRLAIALVLVVGGALLARPARDERHSLVVAIGGAVLRGIGTSYVLLGAYLGGLAILTASIPDGTVLSGEPDGPSPTVTILMVYGIPALALLALATTGIRAWTAAAGALLPMIVVLIMAQGGASTAIVSVTMLVIGLALTVVVIRSPADATWGNLASAAAAMATSFAFGAGTSPFGTLGATQLAGAPEASPAGRLSASALIVVLAGALLVAALLLLIAIARRDVAGGIIAGSIFTMPPVLLATWLPPGSRWPTEATVALAGVPALIALAAVLAIRLPGLREAIIAVLPWHHRSQSDLAESDSDRPNGTQHPEAEPPAGPEPTAGSEPPAGAWPTTRVEPTAGAEPQAGAEPTADAWPTSRVEPTAGAGSQAGAEPTAGDWPTGRAEPTAGAESQAGTDAARSGTVRPDSAEPDTAQSDGDWPRRPSSAIATAACAVIVAAAAVAFVILAVPVLAWAPWVQGAVSLVVLVGAGALGYWLPANPGAAASIVGLLAFGLASPWARLLTGSLAGASGAERVIAGVLDFLGAAVLAWFLVRRHPRAGVFAAAAYTLAGSTAALLGSILINGDYFTTGEPPFSSEVGPVIIVVLPLLLLGLATAVALLRGHLAIGQAVGAVVFAAAGFVPLKVLVGQFAGGGVEGYALQFALNPLTPTDWLQVSAGFREVTGPVLAAVLIMLALALAAATSLAVRPSAPLAGAVALLLLASVQTALLTVLSTGTTDDAALLGQVLGGLAVVVAVSGVGIAFAAARRT